MDKHRILQKVVGYIVLIFLLSCFLSVTAVELDICIRGLLGTFPTADNVSPWISICFTTIFIAMFVTCFIIQEKWSIIATAVSYITVVGTMFYQRMVIARKYKIHHCTHSQYDSWNGDNDDFDISFGEWCWITKILHFNDLIVFVLTIVTSLVIICGACYGIMYICKKIRKMPCSKRMVCLMCYRCRKRNDLTEVMMNNYDHENSGSWV